MSNHPSRLASWAVRLALFCSAVVFGIVMTLQWLRTDYDPLRYDLSRYVYGPLGVWMKVAFYSFALSLLSLSLACWRMLPHNQRAVIGIAFLITAGTSCALVGIFDTEGYPPKSLVGVLHDLGGGWLFLGWDIAMLLLLEPFWGTKRIMKRIGVSLSILASSLQGIFLWSSLSRLLFHSAFQKFALFFMWLYGILLMWHLLTQTSSGGKISPTCHSLRRKAREGTAYAPVFRPPLD